MTIANAMKEFFFKLNGTRPGGTNIADVIRNGASGVQLGEKNNVEYEAADAKSFVLKSSTTDSTKEFRITVADDGTLTATEIVAESPGEDA